MSDVVRLRNVDTQELRIVGSAGDLVVPPGAEFEADPRTAAIVARIARVERVPEPEAAAPAPAPAPIIIPVGARTAGGAR